MEERSVPHWNWCELSWGIMEPAPNMFPLYLSSCHYDRISGRSYLREGETILDTASKETVYHGTSVQTHELVGVKAETMGQTRIWDAATHLFPFLSPSSASFGGVSKKAREPLR